MTRSSVNTVPPSDAFVDGAFGLDALWTGGRGRAASRAPGRDARGAEPGSTPSRGRRSVSGFCRPTSAPPRSRSAEPDAAGPRRSLSAEALSSSACRCSAEGTGAVVPERVPLAALGFDADAGGRAALDPDGLEAGASDMGGGSPIDVEADCDVDTEAPVPARLPSEDSSAAPFSAAPFSAASFSAVAFLIAPFPEASFSGARSVDESASSGAGDDVAEDAGTVESSDMGGGGIMPKDGHGNLSMPNTPERSLLHASVAHFRRAPRNFRSIPSAVLAHTTCACRQLAHVMSLYGSTSSSTTR